MSVPADTATQPIVKQDTRDLTQLPHAIYHPKQELYKAHGCPGVVVTFTGVDNGRVEAIVKAERAGSSFVTGACVAVCWKPLVIRSQSCTGASMHREGVQVRVIATGIVREGH